MGHINGEGSAPKEPVGHHHGANIEDIHETAEVWSEHQNTPLLSLDQSQSSSHNDVDQQEG